MENCIGGFLDTKIQFLQIVQVITSRVSFLFISPSVTDDERALNKFTRNISLSFYTLALSGAYVPLGCRTNFNKLFGVLLGIFYYLIFSQHRSENTGPFKSGAAKHLIRTKHFHCFQFSLFACRLRFLYYPQTLQRTEQQRAGERVHVLLLVLVFDVQANKAGTDLHTLDAPAMTSRVLSKTLLHNARYRYVCI